MRLWIQESAGADGALHWQGSITHVPSEEYKYFTQLAEIASFLTRYLNQMGAQIENRDRTKWWRGLRLKIR